MTKAQKIAEYDHVARERDTFMLALNDVLNQDVEFSSWCKESDSQGKYRVGMSRLDAADGGLMIVTYRHPGQGDYTTAQTLDSMESIGYLKPPGRTARPAGQGGAGQPRGPAGAAGRRSGSGSRPRAGPASPIMA